jgi:hypothetical protein
MSIEAMKLLVAEMEYVLNCINKNKIPFDGDDFHEALRLGRQAIEQAKKDQTWVELTDEEISSIAFKAGDEESAIHLAMDLLKEKNI